MTSVSKILNLHKYFLIYVVLFLVTVPAHAARQVEAKRECATCHIMWLDEFKRKDVTPLIPYDPKPVTKTGKQDATSTERMCFSCHDGFVLDSRFMWKQGQHGHPVGKIPPKNMKIPTSKGKTTFPLNDEGKIYCGTCHTAHGVEWGSEISPIFLRVKNVDSSLCLACHLEKSSGPKEGNHPVYVKPHQKPAGLLEAGSKLAADGSVICESCHRPHGGEQERMLVKTNAKSALCYSCHENKRGVVESKHDMTVMAPKLSNIHGDDIMQKGPCSACHVPHGGQGPGLWARKLPSDGKDKTAAMCTSCHSKEGVAKEKMTGIHSHPVDIKLDNLNIVVGKTGWTSNNPLAQGEQAPQALPLFDTHGQRTQRQGRVSCPSCHDPHNWSVIDDLKQVADPKNSEGDGNTSFLRIAQGDKGHLCLNCHTDKRAITYTKHDVMLPAVNTNESTPVRKDTCAHCHAVHNAKGMTLRNRDKGPGEMPIETWCKDCHKPDGMAKDKQITEHSHPLGKHPDQMKAKSALPLFDKDGKRTEQQGLVDCATCHDPHQWTPGNMATGDQHTSEQEGDGNNSFLRLAATQDAQLCETCHKDNVLVIGTDHDMRVTAPASVNEQGESTRQSGVCGQCHAVHNSAIKTKLWARGLGDGVDINEQFCTSCHQDSRSASKKVPQSLRHPAKVKAWSGEVRELAKLHSLPSIPVFDEDGNKSHSGVISCPSCHNPHQWDPRRKVAGTGKNEEGDSLTSFLRNSTSEYIVCADCHGKDALFRYKYFHGKMSRKEHPLYR